MLLTCSIQFCIYLMTTSTQPYCFIMLFHVSEEGLPKRGEQGLNRLKT